MEEWVNIDDIGMYAVSNWGRIRRNEIRKDVGRHKNVLLKEMILKVRINRDGYYQCILRINGLKITKTIHRLVAIHFIPNPENKPQVNHKDGDKLNNHINNLEWNTSKENINHALENGLKKVRFGNNATNRKLFEYQVLEIKDLILKGESTKSIASKYNICLATIYAISAEKIWKHLIRSKE